jgi:hypothetical protein
MSQHRKHGDSDEQAIDAVLQSDDARDWYLSSQDVANTKAKDVDRHTWKRAQRDVESVWLAVRTHSCWVCLSTAKAVNPDRLTTRSSLTYTRFIGGYNLQVGSGVSARM